MRDTIDMAREVGLHIAADVNWMPVIGLEHLKAFEALVRADEREACAKICEREYDTGLLMAPESPSLAAAIRARGQA